MKYLAHRKPDGSDKPIFIGDVVKGRNSQYPEDWREGKVYYSLWYQTPMKAVVNGKTPHFAFIKGAAAGHGEGGESLEHSLSKKIVSELELLKIKAYRKVYEVPIKNSRLENPEQFRGNKYRIDVMLEVDECEFTRDFGTYFIGIEIKKGNGVKSVKKYAIRNVDKEIALLEISLNKAIKLEGNNIDKLSRRLEGYWTNQRFASVLNNPNYKAGLEKHKEETRIETEKVRLEREKLQAEREQRRKAEIEMEIQRRLEESMTRPRKAELIAEPMSKKLRENMKSRFVYWAAMSCILFIIIVWYVFQFT